MSTETTTRTMAEQWADARGYTDGQTWHGTDGEHLADVLRDAPEAERAYKGQEAWAYRFEDGSVIFAHGAWWDLAPSLEDATTECGYCGARVPIEDAETVPADEDDSEWDRLAHQHADGCEWIQTRAHRR